MYKLTKLELEKGKASLLGADYTSELPDMHLFDWETGENKSDQTIKDITEGWQVILTGATHRDYHRTSKISEILEHTDKYIKFKTQTSIYEMSYTEDETI